jgi:hypothetical protein
MRMPSRMWGSKYTASHPAQIFSSRICFAFAYFCYMKQKKKQSQSLNGVCCETKYISGFVSSGALSCINVCVSGTNISSRSTCLFAWSMFVPTHAVLLLRIVTVWDNSLFFNSTKRGQALGRLARFLARWVSFWLVESVFKQRTLHGLSNIHYPQFLREVSINWREVVRVVTVCKCNVVSLLWNTHFSCCCSVLLKVFDMPQLAM